MIQLLKILVVSIAVMICTIKACKTTNPRVDDNRKTLQKLYEVYKKGDIAECTFKGDTVYNAGLNAYDAGSKIFDKEGNEIGTCNYAWGPVLPICTALQDCEVIYRCENHITGNPPVDKYGLSEQKK